MKTTRRHFIKVTGSAGAALSLSSGITGCSFPDDAIEAWKGPASAESDPRFLALSYAILAPNPHNMQPCIIDLSKPGEIMFYCDQERLLPETDPFSRQIMIGNGCFLELLEISAKQFGYQIQIDYFPECVFPQDSINEKPVARIVFEKDQKVKPDPLFHQILKRHTNRETYDETEMTTRQLAELSNFMSSPNILFSATHEEKLREKLRKLTFEGHEAELLAPKKWQESIDVSRIGADEIRKHRDGLSFGGTFFELLGFFGIMTKSTLADTSSMAFQSGMDEFKLKADSAQAFAWLTTADNQRKTQLETGRAYVRMQLKITEMGMVLHPWSQVLQEYEEVQHLQEQFLDLVKTPKDHTVQMLVRLGFSKDSKPAPRRKIRDFILS